MNAEEILARAADIVEFSGRFVNRCPRSENEVCAVYALLDAGRGDTTRKLLDDAVPKAYYTAFGALAKEIGTTEIPKWSDASTKEEVATALRNAKRHLEPDHGNPGQGVGSSRKLTVA
jgi:hypothetical protein